MDDSDTLPATLRPHPRPTRLPMPDDHAEPEETIAPGDAFAVARGTRPSTGIKFIMAGDVPFHMPYSFPYIVWDVSPALILLEYPRFFTMLLAGHGLAPLEAALTRHRVTWIRQCDPGQAAGFTTAVTRIERLQSFPSREPAGNALAESAGI